MKTKKVAVLSSLVLSASLVVSPFVSAASFNFSGNQQVSIETLLAAKGEKGPNKDRMKQSREKEDNEDEVKSNETVSNDDEQEVSDEEEISDDEIDIEETEEVEEAEDVASEEDAAAEKNEVEEKKGLRRAFENVKGTPAEQVIQTLLQKKYSLEDLTSLVKDLSDEDEEDTGEDADIASESESTTSNSETTTEDETDLSTTLETTVDTSSETGPIQKLSKNELKKVSKELRNQFKAQQKKLKDELKRSKGESEEVYSQKLDQYKQMIENLAELQEQSEDIDDAFELQTEAVKADLLDKKSYKKLAKLYEKLNQYEGVKTFVNGESPAFDVPPVVKQGRTLVPFRAISNALKAEVKWIQEEQAVYVERDGLELKLILGDKTAYINGQEVPIDVPASLINNRTFVPLRFISEAFGAKVDWEDETETAIIVEDPTTETSTTIDANATGTTTDTSTAPAN